MKMTFSLCGFPPPNLKSWSNHAKQNKKQNIKQTPIQGQFIKCLTITQTGQGHKKQESLRNSHSLEMVTKT